MAPRKDLTVHRAVICDDRAHVHACELGGIGVHGRGTPHALHAANGKWLTADEVRKAMHTTMDYHRPVTTIVSLENTIAGEVHPIDEIRKIEQVAREHGCIMHLDGARLWNACAATDLKLSDFGQIFDSMSLCLSKGLGAPIGSVLVGSKDFIHQGRQLRKAFGGGMRQTGILAAACLYAVEHHWPLMKQDHVRTQKLGAGLQALGFEMRISDTNQVWFKDPAAFKPFLEPLREAGFVTNESRLVCHHQTTDEDVDALLATLGELVAKHKA